VQRPTDSMFPRKTYPARFARTSSAGRRLFSVAVIALGLTAQIALATGAKAEESDLRQRYNAAFNRTLQEPANLDGIFEFANLAVQVGDVEGAIGAYERMLIYNPELPRVRYDLGRLYFKLGSYRVAQRFFQQVLDTTGVPRDIREDVQKYMADIEKHLARNTLTGSLSTGTQYQTNANFISTNSQVRVFGIDATLTSSSRQRADTNLFLAGDATDIFDLDWQGGETIETTFTGYGSHQFRVHQNSLGYAEMTSGMRIPVLGPNDFVQASVKPYAIGTVASLDYSPFFGAYGAGLSLRTAFSSVLQSNLSGEFRQRDFHNSAKNPSLTDKNGQLTSLLLTTDYALYPTDVISAILGFDIDHARAQYERYTSYSVQFGYTRLFDAPLEITDKPWSIAGRGGVVLRPYDAADPSIDPGTKRYDRQYLFSALLTVGITDEFSANLQLSQDWTRSSVPNFRYSNTSALSSIIYHF